GELGHAARQVLHPVHHAGRDVVTAYEHARRPAPHRCGTVAVSVIAAMVILQLVVVGMVVAGARDQGATVLRLDGSRAFYAAEGGMSMAFRELRQNTDTDGDGCIGG